VDMHALRIEAAGKVEDLGLFHPDLTVFENGARDVVLEKVVFGQRQLAIMRRPGLNPAGHCCITSPERISRGYAPEEGRLIAITSSAAAVRPGRSWRTGCRRRAATRCCCARPVRIRRTARCRPK